MIKMGIFNKINDVLVVVTSTMTYCSPAAKIITTVLAKFNM